MKIVDIFIGIAALVLAGLLLRSALSLDFFQRSDIPGPGFLPTLLAIAIAIVGVLLVVTRMRGSAADFGPFAPPTSEELARSLAAWAGLLAAIYLFDKIGFFASSVVLIALLLFGIERLRTVPAVASVVAIPALFFLVFSVLLKAPLPVGPWGF